MASSPQSSKSMVLNSWKEIAGYVGRGVRTVQRYERDLGLPVRRPHGRSRSAVMALAEELDAWLRKAPRQEIEPDFPALTKPIRLSRETIEASLELRNQCNQLRAAHSEAVTSLLSRLHETLHLMEDCKELRGQPGPSWKQPVRSATNGRIHGDAQRTV